MARASSELKKAKAVSLERLIPLMPFIFQALELLNTPLLEGFWAYRPKYHVTSQELPCHLSV
jgi:hypothetical protein